ncbi:MAG: acyl-CoA dehydrogenase family protein [Anaerolineales bacterium]|nr:acyl-CoA dehydrogenase family protein [Anaerolineales bacterium]
MQLAFTPEQQAHQQTFHAFVQAEVLPRVEAYDEAGVFPPELVSALGQAGYLGALAPTSLGGLGLDMLTFGLLNEALGQGCASARSLLTVHSMVLASLLRWGSAAQKARWLPGFVSGRLVGAFALTEPESGSDANSLATAAMPDGEGFRLTGCKKWITFGQTAGLFLLFAKLDGRTTAFLVERDTPGLTVVPIAPPAGCRASMLAELRLESCRVPAANLLGRAGAGWTYVANTALDNGRYSVAWGCVGLAQACLDATVAYTGARRQFGAFLKEHQLIQAMLTDMVANVEAARLLCCKAGYLQQTGDPGAPLATSLAKYFAARAAGQVASEAVQAHGANGFSRAYPVQRHWRDAKVMDVIEGSRQIQQMVIGRAYAGR